MSLAEEAQDWSSSSGDVWVGVNPLDGFCGVLVVLFGVGVVILPGVVVVPIVVLLFGGGGAQSIAGHGYQ